MPRFRAGLVSHRFPLHPTLSLMPLRILVVDDDELVRKNLELVLSMEGYGVTTADSGFAVVEVLDDVGADLVVLDISMPGMDGWETLQWLRRRPSTAKLPIVALSGDRHDTSDFRRAGFNAYLPKGGSLERFLCTIRCAIEMDAGAEGKWLHSCNGQRCLASPLVDTIPAAATATIANQPVDHTNPVAIQPPSM
jgi:CheY-like chemotaxis protein